MAVPGVASVAAMPLIALPGRTPAPQIDRASVHDVAFGGDEVLPAELVLSGESRVATGAARIVPRIERPDDARASP